MIYTVDASKAPNAVDALRLRQKVTLAQRRQIVDDYALPRAFDRAHVQDEVKTVLRTCASLLHKPHVSIGHEN